MGLRTSRTRPMTPARARVLALLLAVSAVTLGLGLVGPCMTVIPKLGELTGWVEILRPDELAPTTYSVLSGINAMRLHGSPGLAALLLGFSVVFPALKLAAMSWGTAALALGVRTHAAVAVTHHLGKFSMLDVMVIGLLVIAIKGLPGGSEVLLGWGVYCFAASVVLSLFASILLHGSRPAAASREARTAKPDHQTQAGA